MPGWFDVSAPVGVGLTNSEDDMRRLDGALRTLNAYTPAAHHTEPVSYITRELDDGIKAFQEQNMLKVDGVVNPGGETAQSTPNKLARAACIR
jgi:murein L,D-transpeptidase YcbB/YkuD